MTEDVFNSEKLVKVNIKISLAFTLNKADSISRYLFLF